MLESYAWKSDITFTYDSCWDDLWTFSPSQLNSVETFSIYNDNRELRCSDVP